MDESTAGFTAPTDTGGGEASTSPAGSLTSAPSESAPVNGADLVSSFLSGNTEPTANAPEASPSAPVTPDESSSSAVAGGQEPQIAIPATDEDLSQLTDQTAVGHIRGLRQHVRGTLEPKAKERDEVFSVAEKFGIEKALFEPSFQLMNGLMAVEQRQAVRDGQPQFNDQGQPVMEDVNTTYPFWDSLSKLSEPHLTQLLNDAVDFFPDYIAQRIPQERVMQSLGVDAEKWKAFEEFQANGANGYVPSAAYDPDIASQIPAELQDAYRLANPDLQTELNLMAAPVRDVILRQQQQLQAIEQRDKQSVQQAQQAQVQARQQAEEKRVVDFTQQQEQAFMAELQKAWQPFGPGEENATKNARLHQAVYRDVSSAMYSDPKLYAKLEALGSALRANNTLARQTIMTQLNVDIARLRNEAVEFYGASYRAANGNLQQQRDANAEIKQVTHTGGMPDNRQPDQLPEGDNRAALRALAGGLGIHLG